MGKELAVKTCRCGSRMEAISGGGWACGHCDRPCARVGCPRCKASQVSNAPG